MAVERPLPRGSSPTAAGARDVGLTSVVVCCCWVEEAPYCPLLEARDVTWRAATAASIHGRL
jgi:hypothetical protein